MIKFISYSSLLRDLRLKRFGTAGLTNGAVFITWTEEGWKSTDVRKSHFIEGGSFVKE